LECRRMPLRKQDRRRWQIGQLHVGTKAKIVLRKSW
jgi:hypothetical protein